MFEVRLFSHLIKAVEFHVAGESPFHRLFEVDSELAQVGLGNVDVDLMTVIEDESQQPRLEEVSYSHILIDIGLVHAVPEDADFLNERVFVVILLVGHGLSTAQEKPEERTQDDEEAQYLEEL